MSGTWIALAAIVGGFSMIIAIASIAARTKQQLVQNRTNVQMKLIERFGTANEFVQFIKSEEGRHFLGDPPGAVRERAAGGVRSGIVMGFLGAGFAFIGLSQHDPDWLIPAFMLMGLGLGFFISAMVSMRLSRNLEKQSVSNDSDRS
jgi:hypothetical protein